MAVNDYLANRDSQWMGKFTSFGFKSGCVTSVNEEERKIATMQILHMHK